MIDKRQARGETTRRLVIEIARRVLLEEGLERFVLRRIADQAAITLGNLQYHFATRDELLEAVVRAGFDEDRAGLAKVIMEGERRGLAWSTRSSRLITSWSSGSCYMFLAVALLAEHDDRFALLAAEIYPSFGAVLEAYVRQADPDATSAELTARSRILIAVLDGVALQLRLGGSASGARRKRLLADAAATVTAVVTGGVKP